MGTIRRSAVVVQSTDTEVIVEACRESACVSCAAKAMCSVGEDGDKGGRHKIVLLNDGRQYEPGQQVTLVVSERRAALAVVLAYLLPVLVAIGLLLGLQQAEVSELTAGLVTLGVLVLYFVVIRIFNKKISKELTITIE